MIKSLKSNGVLYVNAIWLCVQSVEITVAMGRMVMMVNARSVKRLMIIRII